MRLVYVFLTVARYDVFSLGIQAPGLSFRCICPSRQPHQDLFRVRFLFAVYIAWPLLLVALSSSVGNLVVLDLVRSPWWNVGIQLGRSQPRAGLVGKHSRGRTSLSQTSYLPKVKGKGETGVAVETPLPPCLSEVSEQSEPNGEDAVMEDCTETHQAEINKKIKANGKLRKIPTNMAEGHRAPIYGDSFKSKMQSLDDERATYWQFKGNSCPCKVGSKNRRIIWSGSRKRSNRSRRKVWKF